MQVLNASRLAQAAGVRPADVSAFTTRAWPAAGAALAWGVANDQGDPQPWLLVQQGSAAPQALRLAAGQEVALLAWLDLKGAPAKLNLLAPPAQPEAAQAAPGAPAQPAALLRVRQQVPGGERRSTLLLVALGSAAATLWREVEATQAADGGGYRSHQLALLRAAAAGPLELELGQTTVPGKGAQPQMPGPPLALRFGFDGQVYQRLR